MNTVTIRAKAVETINPNSDEGFPSAVVITGGKFLSHHAALEVAQEAVDSIYGEYGSGYVATLNYSEWDAYKINSRLSFTAKVVKL